MAPPVGAIPPTLPPSVEEAYRRKCIQLKQRMNEVEESNDAARLRIARIGREIEKLRLERAFLFENLAKRTSTNVEDSEGSPSPPPTPKDKPLRTKRGHRKPSFMQNASDGGAGGGALVGVAFGNQGPANLSPMSETFSQTQPPKRNGQPSRRIKNAFDLYCSEVRPIIGVEDGTDLERALAEGWQGMSTAEKEDVHKRYEALKKTMDAENGNGHGKREQAKEGEDEDVEMGDDNDGGFTAVNRS